MTEDEEIVDVRRLLAESSVEELCRLAEDYFAQLDRWEHHLAKPFGSADETPQLLINFAVVLQGLAICPGMTVLEFGAGTCWASRFLSQLDCRVIAVDVSPTALRIGQELYTRQPLIGDKPPPSFSVFDGHHINLPDKSVERIMCLDAFHHVPNPAHVLAELGRVLADGGIAGFAEPGPEHSRSPQSQYEMKKFKVIENDIDIQEIWQQAQQAGFTDIKLAVFNIPLFQLGMREFEDFLSGGETSQRYAEAARAFMQNQRNFFLYKGKPAMSDSRYRAGLTGKISVALRSSSVKEGEIIRARATVTNSSASVWLPRSAGIGAVHLGCHVYDSDGKVFQHSYHWEALTTGEGRHILPNETVETEVYVPALPRGRYILEFDLVSNEVCWFVAVNGSQPVRVAVEVF